MDVRSWIFGLGVLLCCEGALESKSQYLLEIDLDNACSVANHDGYGQALMQIVNELLYNVHKIRPLSYCDLGCNEATNGGCSQHIKATYMFKLNVPVITDTTLQLRKEDIPDYNENRAQYKGFLCTTFTRTPTDGRCKSVEGWIHVPTPTAVSATSSSKPSVALPLGLGLGAAIAVLIGSSAFVYWILLKKNKVNVDGPDPANVKFQNNSVTPATTTK